MTFSIAHLKIAQLGIRSLGNPLDWESLKWEFAHLANRSIGNRSYGNCPSGNALTCESLPKAPSAGEIDNLLGSLQATFSDAAHRHMLIKIVSNSETLKNLMDCVPGLRKDAKAQAVLNDPYLLIHWFNVENASENFTAHPSLFVACQQLVEHMHAELVRHRGIPPALFESGIGGMDGYSSAEDEDDENAPGRTQPNASLSNQTPRIHITPEYLAAALAAATATSPRNAAASTSQTSAPSTVVPIANVAPTWTPRPAAAAPAGNILTTEIHPIQKAKENDYMQFSELESMGFNNREENLRALRNSNGDVYGALEFIINERERIPSSCLAVTKSGSLSGTLVTSLINSTVLGDNKLSTLSFNVLVPGSSSFSWESTFIDVDEDAAALGNGEASCCDIDENQPFI
uniref:UBA domain-containing protein n=1 Tax=Romanomermis culicivorax TaxID=13658 RepID=A0A915J5H5_ROMCU